MKRLAVLISGNGSNMQAIIEAIQTSELEAEITLVVSNRRDAYGLVRAEKANIPTLYFPLKPYLEAGASREAYDAALAERLATYKLDLIVLAGWMHVFSPAFLDCFPQCVLNLHPALPGQFPGVYAIERAYEAFQQGKISHTGIMVHWVVAEIDAGPVVATAEVPIYATDNLANLEHRVHTCEHQLLVEAIRRLG